jgi:hypothetical protein
MPMSAPVQDSIFPCVHEELHLTGHACPIQPMKDKQCRHLPLLTGDILRLIGSTVLATVYNAGQNKVTFISPHKTMNITFNSQSCSCSTLN